MILKNILKKYFQVENKDKLWNMEAESDPAEGGAAGMKNEYEESYDDPGI